MGTILTDALCLGLHRTWARCGRQLCLLLLCLSSLSRAAMAQSPAVTSYGAGTISTFAGIQGSYSDNGENGPATAVAIGGPDAMAVDSTGNVYFANASNYVRIVYVGGTVPPLLATVTTQPHQGWSYVIAGNNANALPCASSGVSDTCGDGGSALSATLNTPSGLAFDTSGNLYIADEASQAIREIYAASTTVGATTYPAGTIVTIAGDPNHLAAAFSGDGGPAKSALLNYPDALAFDATGNLYISDGNNFIVRKINAQGNISTVAGTPMSQCVSAQCGDGGAAASALLDFPGGVFVTATGDLYIADEGASTIRKVDAKTQNISTVAGVLGISASTASFPDSCTTAPCGDGGPATSALLNGPTAVYVDTQGNLLIADTADQSLRAVDASGTIQTVVGQISVQGGSYGGDGGPANSALLNTPNGFAFDAAGNLYLSDSGNDAVREVTSPPQLKAQTITFTPPLNTSYGAPPIDLSASASATSGLAVSFAVVSGPATITGTDLSLTGAGTVVVRANQNGDGITWAPATPVSASITVAQGTLTATAQNASLKEGNPIPLTFPFTITGLVAGDTTTGAPSIQVKDSTGTVLPPGNVPPPGVYTIAIGQGTLSASANYTFKFINGQLLVTAGNAQTVSFSSFTPPAVYGGPGSSFTFHVTSSAGLPVTVTGSGPVQLQQTSTGWSATVNGAGLVTLTALQAGNDTYTPASQTSQFTVNPALLTIPINNATRVYGAPNPIFTYGAPSGFVGSDTTAVFSGAPAYSTTATAASAPGQYPITATQGTLFAQSYTFAFVPATLTVTQPTQQITGLFTPANVAYPNFGDSATQYPLGAVASSNLPVQYSSTGPVVVDPSGLFFTVSGVGPASVTATQPGNADYPPASATVTFTVAQGVAYVSAQPATRPFGANNPVFQWCFTFASYTSGGCEGSIAFPANLYTGAPVVTSTAAQDSPSGTYPIAVSAGTLTSSVYTFQFIPSTLTVTAPSTYVLTVSPTSVIIPNGQSRQVTVTLTPLNNYAGEVMLGCSGLPAGVTCTSSPSSLTPPVNASNGNAQPISGTITISAGQSVASASNQYGSGLLSAGFIWLPAVLAGCLLFWRRREFKRNSTITGLFVVLSLIATISSVVACGGGNSSKSPIVPGTTQITITGAGVSSSSTANVNQSVGLQLTIQ